jgi:hypothetical protein
MDIHAGQPEFRVNYDYNEAPREFNIKCTADSENGFEFNFQNSGSFKIVSTSGTILNQLLTTEQTNTYTFRLDDSPLYVLFNSGNSVLSKVYFSKPKRDWLNQWHYSKMQ